MSSPRNRLQVSFNDNLGYQKTRHYQSYDSIGDGNYDTPPISRQNYRQQGCYTSPYSRKHNGNAKPNRIQRIKSLKGVMNSIILQKKSDTKNITNQFNSIKAYQTQIIDQFYELKKSQMPLGNFNSGATPRNRQSQKYRTQKNTQMKNKPDDPQNYNNLQRRDKYSSNLYQKPPKDFQRKMRTQKNQEKLLQSNHAKPAHFKPTHKRKQSSELFIQRPYSFQQQNQILKSQNTKLIQEVKKSKSYINLLERQIRQLNQYIKTIEKAQKSDQNHHVINSLKDQIHSLNKKIQELSQQNLRDKDKDKKSQEIVNLRLQIKNFKEENQHLRKNLMKLLNSKLETVSSPTKDKKQTNISVEQLKQLHEQLNYYRGKFAVLEQQYPLQNGNKTKVSLINNHTPIRVFEGTSKRVYQTAEQTNPKSKAETAWKQMANLLHQRTQNDTTGYQNAPVSYFQY